MLFQASLLDPLFLYWNRIIKNVKATLYRSNVLWNCWANTLIYWLHNFLYNLELTTSSPAHSRVCKSLLRPHLFLIRIKANENIKGRIIMFQYPKIMKLKILLLFLKYLNIICIKCTVSV